MTDVPFADRLAYTVPEVAAMVGLSPNSIRKLVADGRLVRVRFTDRVLIARVELERWTNPDEFLLRVEEAS